MNQRLRDFSDRHFEVVFTYSSWDDWTGGRSGRQQIGEFQRYEDASRFQKATVAGLKRLGLHKRSAFPIGWYVTLHGRTGAWEHSSPEKIRLIPKNA